jgi:predicted nucleotidyltransferase
MSGNFTQRGEPAVLDKFTRAKHAIIAGADLVIELPTVFATANAETFATGAVNLIHSLGCVDGLCFGVESGDKDAYLKLARAMNDESKEFKKALKEKLDSGISLAKAKFEALKSLNDTEFDASLISTPNNILGLEYTKAILKNKSDIEIYPMPRQGNHNDISLKKGITSATSIREVLKTGKKRKVKGNVPKFVYGDLGAYPFAFDKLITASAIKATAEDLAKISDCTEGLENRIKALSKDNHTICELVEKVSTKRYPASRVRRILTANLLGIDNGLVCECLKQKTYAKILATNKDSKDLISLLCKTAQIPVLTRKSDSMQLKKCALKCFELDVLANDLYCLATSNKTNEHQMLLI